MDSFIPRIGGKRILRKDILARFPKDPVGRYVEAFGGAGWLLFSKDRHAPEEIFNDIDGELINLFRCVKNHAEELQRQMEWMLNSRELFEDAIALKCSRGLTDIQRAALYFVAVKESYGADVRTYGSPAKNLERVTEYLSKVKHRLQTVKIENRSYDIIIKQYDRTDALLYLDPPYHGTEGAYDSPFTDNDHHNLRRILGGINGKFILSYNDDSFVRSLYSGFYIEEISRNSNLANRYPTLKGSFRELIIRNF